MDEKLRNMAIKYGQKISKYGVKMPKIPKYGQKISKYGPKYEFLDDKK